MKSSKKAKLEKAGWKVGSASDFLGLSPEEESFLEMKAALAMALRKKRQAKRLTQSQLAKLIGSSQPRVALMEAADSTVSVDLLVRSLLAIGATRRELARVIGSSPRTSA